MIKIFYKLFILTFLARLCYGQANYFSFNNITVKDGLSESSVNVILEDELGFIYIGTDNGLDIYDGYTFRSFYTNSFDQNSILGSKVKLIYEDSKNIIWIATDMGISTFDPVKNIFSRPFDSKYDFGFFSNIVEIEEGKNKNLIFRSKINNDLYVYNDISKKISCLTVKN